MRKLSLILALSLLWAGGCQTLTPQTTEPPGDYRELAQRAESGGDVTPGQLRSAFLASDEFNRRMRDLAPLEQQALQMLDSEPLRLGAVGSAILDSYYGSLTGHYALSRFYGHVGADDEQDRHDQWVARITAAIGDGAEGTETAPYQVVSANEAEVLLRMRRMMPVGSMYYSTEDAPFLVLVAAQHRDGGLENVYFNLTGAYQAIRTEMEAVEGDEQFGPGALIGFLAQQGDSAAQASIGSYLYGQGRYEEAASWFSAATQSGNVLANIMLAQIYQLDAQTLDAGEREDALELALDHYTQAIAHGSTDAMFALGAMYIDGEFGEDNIGTGVALLHQSAEHENTSALLWLGHLYRGGLHVDQDVDRAGALFAKAAELGSPRAQIQYARFLMNEAQDRPFDRQALRWMRDLADDGDPEAMLTLGGLHAKGVGVRRSFRRAVNWYQAAAKAAPDEADIINEVAWTLTVSHLPRLRRPGYALDIMERVMTSDDDARRNPAYLDTWAAAYAANGQFDRALTIQRDAVAAAEETGSEEMIEVLTRHLGLFEQGETITDEIP